jgi:hypothetical protein
MSAVVQDAPERAADILGLPACDRLIAAHLSDVQRHFGPTALGVIDLPSIAPGSLVAAQVRVAAVLYWASELEAAGLIPMVEAIAEGIVRGTFLQPLGASIHPLMTFWRAREHRFTAPERRGLFERLFGGEQTAPQDGQFEAQFGALIEVIAAIARQPLGEGTGLLEARANVAARDVGAWLSDRTAGIAAFAARDIVDQVRHALALLQHPDLVRALGGGSPWQLVARHAPLLLRRSVDVTRHLARATSGLALIDWIARHADALNGGRMAIARTDPIVRDAEAWLAVRGGP